ncbi:MAG: T9SS type A sorting domain-containing protein [Bacteroidetes bacterium]|nr:T9SS type A sorting domain-containing protein [Bacteroidota bacterium]
MQTKKLLSFFLLLACVTSYSYSQAIYTVTNTNDSGAGSLRNAIYSATASPGIDVINFNIAGGGPHIIYLDSPLMISDNDGVEINGFSQPGAVANTVSIFDATAANPLTTQHKIIISNNNGNGTVSRAFEITGKHNIIKGLVISDFVSEAIVISGGQDNQVYGCLIGADILGNALDKQLYGIRITGGNGNQIGNNNPNNANVIYGNTIAAIEINNIASTSNNKIQGNIIGLKNDGSTATGISMAPTGIKIMSSANNTIGGTASGDGNIIAGNDKQIDLQNANGTIVQGNYLGLRATGEDEIIGSVLQYKGVLIDNSNSCIIGGPGAAKNVISDNYDAGILLKGSQSTGNTIKGNFIGCSKTKNQVTGFPYQKVGIRFEGGANNNLVGGPLLNDSNLVFYNDLNGIELDGSGTYANRITQNIIKAKIGNVSFKPIVLQNNAQGVVQTPTITATDLYYISGVTPNSGYDQDTVEVYKSDLSNCNSALQFLGKAAVSGSSWTLSGNYNLQKNIDKVFATITKKSPNNNTSEFSACFTYTNSCDLAATIIHTNVSCKGDSNGVATVNPIGGSLPYTYQWSNGKTTQTVNNLASNSYNVVVTENNGCTTIAYTYISQPFKALQIDSLNMKPATCLQSNGELNVFPSGGWPSNGLGGYLFSWSNGGSTAPMINGLAANFQSSVTVTDSLGCSITSTNQTVGLIPGFSATLTPTNVNCNGNSSGSINTSLANGTGPYNYLWSYGGSTTSNINGLLAGTYSVTIEDLGLLGCIKTFTTQVTQPAALTAAVTSSINVGCFGNATGVIDIAPVGGTYPYTFLWKNGATTEDVTGLSVGTYSVHITDNNNCVFDLTNISITQPASALTAVVSSSLNVACFGTSTGSVDIYPIGGTFPYSFLWKNGATTEDVTGLSVGTYSVHITDNNNCVFDLTNISITQPASALTAAVSSSLNVACFGTSTGSVDIYPIGGTFPYSFLWKNGATTEDVTGLSVGTYSVHITDNNNCVFDLTNISITQPAALSTSINITNVDCFGKSTGSIDITPSGGVGNYSFIWSNASTAEDVTGIPLGTYSVHITDGNGCSIDSINIIITQPNQFSLSITGDSTVCFGQAANLSATIGSGYAYLWSSGNTTSAITTSTLSIDTTYSVLVTNANGCTNTAAISVTVNSLPALTITALNTTTVCSGTKVGLITTGASYYAWNTSVNGTFNELQNDTVFFTPTIPGNAITSLTVFGTDLNTCINTKTIAIISIAAPSANIVYADTLICKSGTALLKSTNSTNYLWMPGGFNGQNYFVSPTTNTTYSLVIQNSSAGITCSDTATTTVNVIPAGTLTGSVTYSGGAVTQGTAVLLRYSFGSKMDTVQLVNLNATNGTYTFTNILPDSFIVFAEADKSIGTYSNTYGTFYAIPNDTIAWDKATKLGVQCANTYTADITLFEVVPPTGFARIAGTVLEGLGFKKKGDPVTDVDVSLGKKPSGSISAVTQTDSTGQFEFENIDIGNYFVYVSIPGLPMDTTYSISVTPTDTVFTGIDFAADSNLITITSATLTSIPKSVMSDGFIKVYPNPYYGSTTVEYKISERANVSVKVYNLLGEVIAEYNEQEQLPNTYKVPFSASELGHGCGTYMVEININEFRQITRIIELGGK